MASAQAHAWHNCRACSQALRYVICTHDRTPAGLLRKGKAPADTHLQPTASPPSPSLVACGLPPRPRPPPPPRPHLEGSLRMRPRRSHCPLALPSLRLRPSPFLPCTASAGRDIPTGPYPSPFCVTPGLPTRHEAHSGALTTLAHQAPKSTIPPVSTVQPLCVHACSLLLPLSLGHG